MPLTAAEDARLLQLVGSAAPPGPLAVAVSGGGDSMALLDLALQCRPAGLHAVTVDHGLRPDAADEAAAVAGFCADRRIPHVTLRWSGPAPSGNLMDQARQARARLIGGWAAGQGIGHVLVGHTADDVAETFLMNLARGAGIDGLSGLRAVWQDHGVTWHRPLLSQTRAALRAWLGGRGIAWAEDPTNSDDRFTRARARKAMAALHRIGITAETVSDSALNLSRARDLLVDATAAAAAALVVTIAGAALCDREALLSQHPEVQRRLLIALVRWIAASPHPPRAGQVDTLWRALAAGRAATLSGVRFRQKGGLITITREPRAITATGPLWDNRWRISGPDGADARAVGAGLGQVPGWRDTGLPRAVLEVTPGLWHGDRLIAAPAAGWPQGFAAETILPLHAIIKAH